VSVTAAELVGREEELARLFSFLEGELPSAIVLEGEAGIGKTTIWREGIHAAEQRGLRVLSTSGAPGETQMAFAGLADLLEPVVEEVLPVLPAPQREALEATLLLGDSPVPHGGRPTSAALLTALRALAGERRILVAVDDVHWLDAASLSALSFVIRRLREEPIALVLALRTGEGAALPFDFARTSFERRVQRLPIGPLSFGALRHLLQTRTDTRLSRPLLLRIHETSAGNPFFALELVRAIARLGAAPQPGEPLPVPEDLGRLLAESIGHLPPKTREATLACALLARATLDSVSLAIDASAEKVLAPAFEEGILELVEGTVRFSHPLLRSAVNAEASSAARLALHRRLAEIVTDVEERAVHLALSTLEPDPEIARELEQAGRRARARGAQTVGAGLLEHSIRLTPEGLVDERAQRRIDATDGYLEAGDYRRARELLHQVLDEIPHGPLRADALLRLGDYEIVDTIEASYAICSEALREAAGDKRREVEILLTLANLHHALTERQAAVDHAVRGLAIAEEIGDSILLTGALTGLGIYETFLGQGDPVAHYSRAIELETKADPGEPARWWTHGGAYFAPGTMLADWRAKNGELDEARKLLEEQYRRALEAGQGESRMSLCPHLADLESAAGRLDAAERWAKEGLALVEETEGGLNRAPMLCSLAVVEAYRGDLERARETAEEALSISEPAGDELQKRKATDVLCFVELSAGRYEAALAWRAGADERSIGRLPFMADGVEALIALGRVDEAREAIEVLADVAAVPGRRIAGLLLLRSRGMLAAATGDLDRALAVLEEAVSFSAELPLPLERGRTLLAFGQARRRAKQKRLAREALEQARVVCAEIGAEGWAARANEELARIGGKTRERWELTPTEKRVADLVAQGLANKEVAATLVVSVRAVEGNLTRIYGKLGVRSRTELAHLLAKKETQI
jgi:DNA-binding CsgD family transcriptional regulator